MSKRKSTSREKLKANSQEEKIQMWKEHFKNLLADSLKVIDKLITKIIHGQLDIKPGQFTEEELDVKLTKIKNRKVTGLDKILPRVWKTRKFVDLLPRLCNAVCEQKEEFLKRKTKSCRPKRKNTNVKITFQESA